MDARPGILREGRNCWRLLPATRVAFLIDGHSYFEAFRHAAERARSSILIAGWDVDSRVRLEQGGGPHAVPSELAMFLSALLQRRERLHVHVLGWDFAVIYALEREPLPLLRHSWRASRRLHFRLDDQHPVGASHHQKIVVVDDRVAFVGGFDLTKRRWDTPDHPPCDPRRIDPAGVHYGPFHDVQMAVSGPVAGALADLFRERWRRATGERLPAVDRSAAGDPWPDSVRPSLADVPVAIARTEPSFRGRSEVREVEALYLDAIAGAREGLYLESQYFTSTAVCDALARRLEQPRGPEVVLVVPKRCSGWLEEGTMGILRGRQVRRLRQADRYGRLLVCYPTAGDGTYINLHSKVLVADDRLVRVGSSNLSNRSMGLDTECDLAIEAVRDDVRGAIARFRNALLAEHLDVGLPEVEASLEARGGSLRSVVRELQGRQRTLVELEPGEPWLDALLPEASVVDPERPAPAAELFDEFLPYGAQPEGGHPVLRGAALLLALAALTAAWHWTPLGDWLKPETVAGAGGVLQGKPYAGFVVVITYAAAGLVAVPVTLLIAATALVFGPLSAFGYSLVGSVASAALTYGVGRLLGREAVRKLGGERLDRVGRYLSRQGVLTIAAIRLVPIAPFTLVNAIAGASRVNFRSFLGGTVLGMAPGIFVITVLEDRMAHVLADPHLGDFAALAGAIGLAVVVGVVVRRLLARARPPRTRAEDVSGRTRSPSCLSSRSGSDPPPRMPPRRSRG